MKSHRRLKVIHLVEDLKIGGLEKVIAMLALGLDKRRYDVEVWCLARGGITADWLSQRGVSVRVFSWTNYHNPLNILRLAVALRAAKADITHSHGYFAGIFGRLSAVVAMIPRIFAHVHTTYFDFYRRNILIERCLACFSTKIICISKAVEEFVVQREKIGAAKATVVYNGVGWLFDGAEGRVVTRRSLGFGDDDCVLVSVGALVTNKGHHVILEAVSRLVCDHPQLKVLILGEGPQRIELECTARRAGLEGQVVFTGNVREVRQFLSVADIFVLASRVREGLSLAVLEAMERGLPVVASRVGGVPEIVVHGANGFLVPPGDPVALGKFIRLLIEDKEMRRSMGDDGRRRYEMKFKSERMVSEIEALYDAP